MGQITQILFNRTPYVEYFRLLTDFLENFIVNSLKRDLLIDTTFNPPLSHWTIPLRSLVCNKTLLK